MPTPTQRHPTPAALAELHAELDAARALTERLAERLDHALEPLGPLAGEEPASEFLACAEAFARLRDRITQHETALVDLKTRKAATEKRLVEHHFVEHPDVKRVNVAGFTVYRHRQLWAGRADGVTAEQVYDALLDDPTTQPLATRGFNAQTLSAWVRERDAEARARLKAAGNDEPTPDEVDAERARLIPPSLATRIRVTEVHSARATRAD